MGHMEDILTMYIILRIALLWPIGVDSTTS